VIRLPVDGEQCRHGDLADRHERDDMAVIVQVDIEGITEEQYDAVRTKVGWLDDAPTGGLGHFTWWDGDACHNVDAWESEDAFNQFAQHRLGPGMAAVGVTQTPAITIHPAHEVFTPKAVTITAT
jgi:hypothetical protein